MWRVAVEQRCEDLVVQSENKAKELRMELKVQLMFLPESVRQMPWKTFIEDFGGSLANVIQNVKDQDYRQYVAASPLKVKYECAGQMTASDKRKGSELTDSARSKSTGVAV